MIYLDSSATTRLSDNVKNDIISNLDNFGNPSSIYDIGFKTQDIIQKAREKVAKCINADTNEIYFTSGASESNTWALQQPFWCEDYEHHSIINNLLRTNNIHEAKIIEQMYVNNEIGFINDIKNNRIKYKNKLFHCDATQAMSCIKIDVKDLGIDTLSFSGHKINAPKGVGVLYVKNGIKLKPLIYGGKQEKGIRGGTENILGISALGIAIEDAYNNIELKEKHCGKLKQYMIQKLKSYGIDFIINGKNMNTVNSILNVSFKDVESEPILIQLGMKDIYCSSGSACNSGDLEPSETLKWMKIPKEYINGTLRFSFDLDNTVEEIDYTCCELNKIIERIRKQ